MIERCRKGPYSFMIDKGMDHKADKRLVTLVRYFDDKAAQTHLLDMPVCNDGRIAHDSTYERKQNMSPPISL